MKNNSKWPYTNAHFLMIDKTVEILEKEGEEITQQNLGEKVGKQEEAVSGGTAEKYLSDSNKKSYWYNQEPIIRLEKPEGGGRATVYWIHKKHFSDVKHSKFKKWVDIDG